MSDKSHVSLEQRVCVVCASPYDTGTILLDRRLCDSLEQHTVTGWGLCPDCDLLNKQGFIALVEVDVEKSGPRLAGDRYKPESVHRTGQVAHLKREMFHQVFEVDFDESVPCMFVSIGVIDQLKRKTSHQ